MAEDSTTKDPNAGTCVSCNGKLKVWRIVGIAASGAFLAAMIYIFATASSK